MALRYDKYQWTSLEEAVTDDPENTLVAYFEFETYDGVELDLVTTAARKYPPPRPDLPLLEAFADGRLDELDRRDAVPLTSEMSGRGVAKVLQSEGEVAMLMRRNGRYILFLHKQLFHLQTSDKNTAECLKKMIEDHSMGTSRKERFTTKIRIVSVDGAGYNDLCERAIVAGRIGWDGVVILCQAHKVGAACNKKTYGILGQFTKGMISCCKSLSLAGQISHFRQAAFSAIKAKSVWWDGIRDEAAESFKMLVLDMYMPDGEQQFASRRLAILRCAPGDWRDHTRFELLREYLGQTMEEALSRVEKFFIPALFGHAPFVFPEHRWTGKENTFRDIGLPASIHALYQDGYIEYLVVWHRYTRPIISEDGERVHVPMVLDGAAEVAPEAADDLAGDPNASNANARSVTDQLDYGEENRKWRRTSWQWIRSGHFAAIIFAMAFVAPPMDHYLNKEFEMASGSHETRQHYHHINLDEGGAASLMGQYMWPLRVAFEGKLDQTVMDSIASLHDPRKLSAIPDGWKTVRYRHLMFRLLSREAAVIYELLVLLHRQFPFRLLKLTTDPSDAAGVANSCRSSRDAFSDHFIEKYMDNLTAFEPLLILAILIILGRTSTSRIEALNAKLRKILMAKSNATKRPNITNISAEFMLAKLRSRERGLWQRIWKVWREPFAASTAASRPVNSRRVRKNRRKKPGGGGAWRAFVSARCRGLGRQLFSQLAEEYRSLSDEDRLGFKEAGEVATLRHRRGSASFGELARAITRRCSREDTRRRIQAAMLDGRIPDSPHTVALLPPGEFVNGVSQRRADRKILSQMMREKENANIEEVHAWLASDGIAKRDALLASVPALAPFASSLLGSPKLNGVDVFNFCPPLGAELPKLVGRLSRARTVGSKRMFDMFLHDFDEHHKMNIHGDAPALPPGCAADANLINKKPTCLIARICLCAHRGDRLWKLGLFFIRSITTAFARGFRLPVDEGDIVLRVTRDGEFTHDPAALPNCGDLFFHVSLMYWSPLRPTLRIAEKPRIEVGRLAVSATHIYKGVYEAAALALHDDTQIYKSKVYTLTRSERRLVNFDLAELELDEVPNVDEMIHWQYGKPRGGRKARRGKDSDSAW